MSETKLATKADLKEMYDRMLPYLGGSADAGFTPIGTVIPMIAETAPANYLICDGAAYNKSDYPELAKHLLSMTNHSMYEVSGDSTKFKVPDLRGEFMRMTGTNSHANQGSGAAVGVHQDGTEHIGTYLSGSNLLFWGNGNINIPNKDFVTKSSSRLDISGSKRTDENNALFTSRPTNTSVLYCIATKNIYLNPSNDYSTDEKVVGTWIDGSPVYQRVVLISTASSITDGQQGEKIVSINNVNIEKGWIVAGYIDNGSGQLMSIPSSIYGSTNQIYYICVNLRNNLAPQSNTLQVLCNRSALANKNGYVIIQYTKTTS